MKTNKLSDILDTTKFADKTKNQAEFVITRFNESLDWLKGLEHLATVYNKGESIENPSYTVIEVPNYGVGIETILRHIISRYDSLADRTMFCQATLADREDQPMYPLSWYFEGEPVRGVLTDAYDPPKFQYRARLSNESCASKRNLKEFREFIGIPYKHLNEYWVRGDWMSVSKEVIRSKPRSYYCFLYDTCQFDRGILVEECWFMERSFYSIFTRRQKK